MDLLSLDPGCQAGLKLWSLEFESGQGNIYSDISVAVCSLLGDHRVKCI